LCCLPDSHNFFVDAGWHSPNKQITNWYEVTIWTACESHLGSMNKMYCSGYNSYCQFSENFWMKKFEDIDGHLYVKSTHVINTLISDRNYFWIMTIAVCLKTLIFLSFKKRIHNCAKNLLFFKKKIEWIKTLMPKFFSSTQKSLPICQKNPTNFRFIEKLIKKSKMWIYSILHITWFVNSRLHLFVLFHCRDVLRYIGNTFINEMKWKNTRQMY